jgi:hypothetical protein
MRSANSSDSGTKEKEKKKEMEKNGNNKRQPEIKKMLIQEKLLQLEAHTGNSRSITNILALPRQFLPAVPGQFHQTVDTPRIELPDRHAVDSY